MEAKCRGHRSNSLVPKTNHEPQKPPHVRPLTSLSTLLTILLLAPSFAPEFSRDMFMVAKKKRNFVARILHAAETQNTLSDTKCAKPHDGSAFRNVQNVTFSQLPSIHNTIAEDFMNETWRSVFKESAWAQPKAVIKSLMNGEHSN